MAATAHCGDFVTFEDRAEQYAMLVDFRTGPNQGAILGHPYFKEYTNVGEKLPVEFLQEQKLDTSVREAIEFFDPIAKYDKRFDGSWIPGVRDIKRTLFDQGEFSTVETGLVVLAVEKSEYVMEPVVELSSQILSLGLASVVLIIIVGVGFWFLAIRSAKESRERVNRVFRSATETATIATGGSTHV